MARPARSGTCSMYTARSLARTQPASVSELRSVTPESVALAKALKRAGFVFVGPTTMYAAMQACGLVDDHLAGCHRAGATA